MVTKILLIIGPTAVGKSSMLERALNEFPQLADIITYTTRPMRPGESEGHPYHFVTEGRFKELIAQDFYIEWAHVHGRLYGTPRDQIEWAAQANKMVVIDIDVQGAKTLQRKLAAQVVTVFLMPPSIDSLRQRFLRRGITNEADLENRLKNAQIEMAQSSHFDHVIVNLDFDSAYAEVRKVIEKLVNSK